MSLIVFGDSYSDNTANKRTNGPVWSEMIAKGWDMRLESYAQFGATLCPSRQHPSWLAEQIQSASLGSGQTYLIFLGTTDIIESKTAQSKAWIQCIKEGVSSLYQRDTEAKVLIMGVPALDFAPYAQGHETLKDRLVSFNVALEEAVEEWQQPDTVFYNTYQMFSDLLGDPSLAGIENVEQAYWDVCQGQCQESFDRYLWWDSLHLTGAGHRALAQNMLDLSLFNHTQVNATTTTSPAVYTPPWPIILLVLSTCFALISIRHYRLLPYLKNKFQTVTKRNKDYTLV